LLPTPEPEPEAADDLPLSLPSAHEYTLAIEALRLWHTEREQLFFRPLEGGPDPYELPMALGDVTPDDLARAFERLLARAVPEPIRPLNRPRRSLSEQMGIVFRALNSSWRTLEEMVPTPFTREDAVYWFLALLELIRLGQAGVQIEKGDVRFARAHRA
jgi:chromatin segregation and condensation protein Rec8/ScpA/Scc1 (kleisin family)